MSDSTKSARLGQSTKPAKHFPLTCKKIRGKLHYFGKLDNPDDALNK